MGRIDRRGFLKSAPAVGAATYAAATATRPAAQGAPARRTADVKIGATPYMPVKDYPIQPVPYSDVTLTDTFWAPKIKTNAEITIPLEVQKLEELERGFSGNVLEAAIMSLKTHPNPQLQVEVDARVRQLADTHPKGNSGFEVAATYYP
jgi:hypothetical protein